MNNTLSLMTVYGSDIGQWLEPLAQLRINVFREFPYLYDGDLSYEKRYLDTYVKASTSIAVLAIDGDAVVGASTGVGLHEEDADFQQPFIDAKIDPRSVFYNAESILLPRYRGSGLYRTFFQRRENHALTFESIKMAAFCAVQRPGDHPLRPADYAPLDEIWRHFGYQSQPSLTTTFSWKDVDKLQEDRKTMQFFTKPLKKSHSG